MRPGFNGRSIKEGWRWTASRFGALGASDASSDLSWPDGDGGLVYFLHLFCHGESLTSMHSSGTGGKDESRRQ